MKRLSIHLLVIAVLVIGLTKIARAQERDSLPNPLRLEDVLTYARDHRQVIAHHASGRLALDLHDDDVFWCTADPGGSPVRRTASSRR